MQTIHQPSFQLKFKNPVVIRTTGIIAIGIITLSMLIIPRFLGETMDLGTPDQIIITMDDIPQTQQINRPPPPARPAIPVESESEDIADDLTIEETDLDDFVAWDDAPPPPDEGPRVKFIPYDDPPVPIGGYGAIQRNVVYPDIAREAGIEGTVIIQAFIDKKGRVKDTVILSGIPNTGLNEAATEAIRKTRFRPAKQRERAVGVWISIPVNFKLRSSG
ncbi:MAG: energy transducer TonB [Candidatus Marinimicrobia bacterium]|nr:energy transducer TonB [Candidatus Neomarinimicrobiota bacterium]